MKEIPQAQSVIFLTAEGAKHLAYLGETYIRGGDMLDCESVDVLSHGSYVEAKVLPQTLPFIGSLRMLLPHHFVLFVVLDDPTKKIGFHHGA